MNTDALVIRFSSLGDIVLAGAVTGALGRVTFLTHPRYRTLAALLPGVEQVLCSGEDPLPRRARQIVDLHSSLRSRQICLQVRGPVRRVRRHDLRRRLRVTLKAGAPPPPVTERYARAAGVTANTTPWLPHRGGDALILCPTAAHATKQWPLDRFASLGQRWEGPVVVLGGPGERQAVRARADAIAEQGFTQTVAAIGGGRAAVGGDTGLMHLCAAAGVPTVVLFGPTTAEDGFWPAASATPSLPLACRPCSRHGGPRCPFGDHLCMSDLTVDVVWDALLGVLP
jgi:ADP-heptose:LPS heptosyltransferase